MRKYILTNQEKEIIRRYLEDGTRLEGFAVLKNRFFQACPQIGIDFCILHKFYYAIEEDTPPHVRECIKQIYSTLHAPPAHHSTKD